MQTKEPPHLTVVQSSTIEAMFEKERSVIGAVVNPKTCSLPLPLPPKRRGPTVGQVTLCGCVNECTSHFCGVLILSIKICCSFERNFTNSKICRSTFGAGVEVYQVKVCLAATTCLLWGSKSALVMLSEHIAASSLLLLPGALWHHPWRWALTIGLSDWIGVWWCASLENQLIFHVWLWRFCHPGHGSLKCFSRRQLDSSKSRIRVFLAWLMLTRVWEHVFHKFCPNLC